jgi:hypothetical protein
MMNLKGFAGIAAAVAFAGAAGVTGAVHWGLLQMPSQTADPNINTVTWFKQHQPEMTATLSVCNDNPGTAGPACVNAQTARDQLSMDRVMDGLTQQLTEAGIIKK